MSRPPRDRMSIFPFFASNFSLSPGGYKSRSRSCTVCSLAGLPRIRRAASPGHPGAMGRVIIAVVFDGNP